MAEAVRQWAIFRSKVSDCRASARYLRAAAADTSVARAPSPLTGWETSAKALGQPPTAQCPRACASCTMIRLEEVLLLVRLDGAVRGGVGHAREHEALLHLAIIEEGLVRLVDGARHHLAGAGGARARAARIGKVNTVLLSLIQDVGVIRAVDVGLARRGLEGHRVHGHGRRGARAAESRRGTVESRGGGDERSEEEGAEHLA
mmetsp:Transcript_8000/g.23449  ORF Transcript_8000/g.23449 Transcript_8000/m.23449 type:complete len:203 (+) Transcript_8000:127-735(+)